MTEMTSEPFFTRQLGAIAPGYLLLDIPELNGVIQIEAPLEDEGAHLHVVNNERGIISVKRANGSPLQAEVVVPVVVDSHPTERHIRVFEEPVAELKLYKEELIPVSPAITDMWVASGENLVVADINLLQKFVNRIADYARAEQERRRNAGVAVNYLDKPNKYL
jgi:hypothetical protein